MYTAIPYDVSLVNNLATNICGKVIRPTDCEYDDSRRVFNGAINRKPSVIVKCNSVSDVINTVNFARLNKVLVAVRGSGHSVAGHSVCDGGILIDLANMKGMRMDPTKKIAQAQPGVTWG